MQNKINITLKDKETTQKNKEQTVDEEENIKELLFSNGGGAVSFLAGYIHGMVNIIGKDKLKEYKLGGVSAGASLSFFLHLVLHQDEYDMKYFYQEWIRKLFEKENTKYYGFFTSGKPIRAFLSFYTQLKKEKNLKTMNDNVHCAITTFNKFGIPQREIVSQYENDKDLCETIITSCSVPYLIDTNFFANFRGRKALDGGFSTVFPNRFENSKKIFINVLPKGTCGFPFVWKQPKNLDIIHVGESERKLVYPRDIMVWDEIWADEMFMSGLLAANSDQEKLLKLFK